MKLFLRTLTLPVSKIHIPVFFVLIVQCFIKEEYEQVTISEMISELR